MEEFLSNPRGVIIVCCFGAFVLAFNASMLSLLRGDKRFQHEASRWTKAFGGGADVRQKRDAEAAELNRLVNQLKEAKKPQDPPHDQ
jgi:hypothetical protein